MRTPVASAVNGGAQSLPATTGMRDGPPASSLSPRELEVMRLLALGLTRRQIAAELGLSDSTVGHHRTNAASRFGGGTAIDTFRALGWLRVPA